MSKALALTFFLALALASCGGSESIPPTPPDSLPSAEAWKMVPGSWEESERFEAQGQYNAEAGTIEFDRGTAKLTYEVRLTNLAAHMPGSQVLAIARCYGPAGVEVSAVPTDYSSCYFERRQGRLIGEAANEFSPNVDPVEPILADPAQVGETINTVSVVSGGTVLPTRYRTISSIAGIVETSLVENPDSSAPRVYEYKFDGELLENWSGEVKPDGSVDVVWLRRVRVGRNGQ